MSRPVGGILSTPWWGIGGHPSKRSTWGWRSLPSAGRAAHVPCSTLLRVGFTEPTGSPRPLVRSYRTVSPLPVRTLAAAPSAVCSLWHCPAGHPDWPLASTLPYGVPTFLDLFPTGGEPSIDTGRDHPVGSPSSPSSHRSRAAIPRGGGAQLRSFRSGTHLLATALPEPGRQWLQILTLSVDICT